MKNLIIVTLVLFLTSGCSHRIIHKTQNKIDSTQSVKKQWLEIDTSKYQTYERMFIFPFRSNKLNSDSTAYNGLITSPMLPDITDASTWTPELMVKYIKSLPDNINFQNLPIYYERISTGQNGFSKKEKSEIITKVKKDEKIAKVKSKSIPWVFAMSLVISGILLIVWILPRKTKSI